MTRESNNDHAAQETTTTITISSDMLMKGWARLMRQHVDSCAKPACGLCAEYGHEAAAK